jgi:hypothetical protein
MDKAYLDIVRAWLVGRGITFEEGLRVERFPELAKVGFG